MQTIATLTAVQPTSKQVWIHALRTTNKRQIKECYWDTDGICAAWVMAEALGIDKDSPADRIERHIPITTVAEIIRLNDEENLTFSQIADWIEENLSDKCYFRAGREI